LTSQTHVEAGLPVNSVWPGQGKIMAPVDETFRLASGIFYEPAQLESAVTDLVAAGFTKEDLCLAGTHAAHSVIGFSTREAAIAVQHAADCSRLRPLYPMADKVEVLATSGALLRKLLKEAPWCEAEQELTAAWLLPDLFGRFTEHIRQNAIVLLVSAPNPAQQHRSARILLKRSAHTVQTHEFSLSRPARQ
jgi:hypothetical protein